jgi:site-specific DNA recombinase
MRAIGYIRVSTEGQVTDGVSLELQRAKLAAWASLHDAELVAVFADEGVSGARADRPGLVQAIATAKRERAALVVYSLSRLSRSTLDTLQLAGDLERAGCDLVSLQEQVDTTSPAGRVIFRVLAALAEFERDQLAERTKQAMRHMKAQGRVVGSIPHGYQRQFDNIVPNDAEQRVVGLVRELRENGKSLRAIADELTRRGAFNRGGRPYRAESVRAMLRAA